MKSALATYNAYRDVAWAHSTRADAARASAERCPYPDLRRKIIIAARADEAVARRAQHAADKLRDKAVIEHTFREAYRRPASTRS